MRSVHGRVIEGYKYICARDSRDTENLPGRSYGVDGKKVQAYDEIKSRKERRSSLSHCSKNWFI